MTTEPLTPEALDTIEAEKAKSVAELRRYRDAYKRPFMTVTSEEIDLLLAIAGEREEQVAELRRLRTENERLDQINDLIGSLDLSGKTTREGTAWGSILREALALSSRAALTGEATT